MRLRMTVGGHRSVILRQAQDDKAVRMTIGGQDDNGRSPLGHPSTGSG
jgi:hypothetical protein